jgi:hypothetical protein
MTQQQIHELLGISTRTLRHWKSTNRKELYTLLEKLDYQSVQGLINNNSQEDIIHILENEDYYNDQREFERKLYDILTSKIDVNILLKLSKDRTLSLKARARAAYLYSFLTKKVAKLNFKTKPNVGFFHGNKEKTENGLARMYGLTNGIDMQRFNQYKMTGSF